MAAAARQWRLLLLAGLPALVVVWVLLLPGPAEQMPSQMDGVAVGSPNLDRAVAAPSPAAPIDDPRRASVTTDSGVLAEYALSACRADEHNTPGSHKSCILLRNAVVTSEEIFFEEEMLLDGDKVGPVGPQFPAPATSKLMRSRFQLKPYRLTKAVAGHPPPPAAGRRTTFAILQGPVSGAQWLNVWHTIGDFFTTLFDTAQPFFEMGGPEVDLEWITRPALQQVGKGCSSGSECRRLSLFEPFAKLFRGRVTFMEPQMEPLHASFLLVGINTRCCPIPMTGVGTEYCQRNLRAARDAILRMYSLPTDLRAADVGRLPSAERDDRQPASSSRACPEAHLMSRQGDVYRHMTPFKDIVEDLQASFGRRGCDAASLRVVKLSGGLPFGEQVRSVANMSVLIAGRGGGTTLSMFLPQGGLYLSVSGFDRWSPFRDLVPSWIHLEHLEVQLVHHTDPSRPPQSFKAGGKSYVDPNRAAYRVDPPSKISRALWAAWERRDDTLRP
jgi:hypothetical protein